MRNPFIQEKDTMEDDDNKAKLIAGLNDRFRKNLSMPMFGKRGSPGCFVQTRGMAALPPERQIEIWAAVADFNQFSEDNDPQGEHDFGAVTVKQVSESIFWKFDYYANSLCEEGSEDPSDPARCYRVLTLMLASEY
jgi:hypothetical protein